MVRLIIITGANRGFGRCTAVELAKRYPDAHFLLTHRAGSSIDEAIAEVKATSASATVATTHFDMNDIDNLEATVTAAMQPYLKTEYDEVMLVNNAAAIGTMADPTVIKPAAVVENLSVNVVAVMVVTNAFLAAFIPVKASGIVKALRVVNVSSLLAVQPMKGFSLYCSGKAARDMYMRVLTSDYPDVRTLSYSPGPMETGMLTEIRTQHADEGVKKHVNGLRERGEVLTPAQSAVVLGKLLVEDKFTSGAHIDYYDELGLPMVKTES